jgi:hypothetical protein
MLHTRGRKLLAGPGCPVMLASDHSPDIHLSTWHCNEISVRQSGALPGAAGYATALGSLNNGVCPELVGLMQNEKTSVGLGYL